MWVWWPVGPRCTSELCKPRRVPSPSVVDTPRGTLGRLSNTLATTARLAGELEIDMTDDAHPDDLVGAYVIEACPADEARSVAEHASRCPTCAAEIAELSRAVEWIGVSAATAPAPGLRSRVLSAALAVRPAGRSNVSPVSVADHATSMRERGVDGSAMWRRRRGSPARRAVPGTGRRVGPAAERAGAAAMAASDRASPVGARPRGASAW